jgi:hypothetical protein
MLNDGPRKIPSTCRQCGKVLSRDDMEEWFRLCEDVNRDPIELAFSFTPPGAACSRCMFQNLANAYAAGHPVAVKFVNNIANETQHGGRKPGETLQ